MEYRQDATSEALRVYPSDGVCGVLENMNLVVIYLDHLSLKNKGTVGLFRRILELTGGVLRKRMNTNLGG